MAKASKVYKITETIIQDNIYSRVNAQLPSQLSKIKSCIESFIHKRNSSLYDYAPIDRIYWKDSDINEFFKAIDIDKKEITAILPQLYYWKESEIQACKDEFSLTCLMALRYVTIKMPKDQKLIDLLLIYLSFSGKFYAACHAELWPNYTPKREVMDYVINYMLSQKFHLIKTQSVCGAVKQLAQTWLETYKTEFVKDITDERIVYLIHQLRNRIHAFLLNISVKYYEAYEKKLYLNADFDDNFDEEGYRLANNNSTEIASVTEKSMIYFTSNQVNIKTCYASSGSGVDPYDIKAIFENILNDNKKLSDLRFVINILLADFRNRYPNESELTGVKFISHSIAMKPNTKDKNIIALKNIILGWLNTSPRYRKIKTPATKNNYYKAIISYIAITINTANK